MLVGELWGSRLSYELGYALGFAQQNKEPNQIVHSASAVVTYKIKKAWELFVNFELDMEPTYDSALVQGGLRYRF